MNGELRTVNDIRRLCEFWKCWVVNARLDINTRLGIYLVRWQSIEFTQDVVSWTLEGPARACVSLPNIDTASLPKWYNCWRLCFKLSIRANYLTVVAVPFTEHVQFVTKQLDSTKFSSLKERVHDFHDNVTLTGCLYSHSVLMVSCLLAVWMNVITLRRSSCMDFS